MFKKEGPPVLVEVYVDGRAYAKIPGPCTSREVALFELFKRSVSSGEIKNVKPGRYRFNFTKTGFFRTEAELFPID